MRSGVSRPGIAPWAWMHTRDGEAELATDGPLVDWKPFGTTAIEPMGFYRLFIAGLRPATMIDGMMSRLTSPRSLWLQKPRSAPSSI